MVQSGEYIGYTISMFLLVPLSDTKGRRFTFLIGLTLQAIGILIIILGVYIKIWVPIFIGEIFLGICSAIVTMISYVLTS